MESVTSHDLYPPPQCHKLSHFLRPPPPSGAWHTLWTAPKLYNIGEWAELTVVRKLYSGFRFSMYRTVIGLRSYLNQMAGTTRCPCPNWRYSWEKQRNITSPWPESNRRWTAVQWIVLYNIPLVHQSLKRTTDTSVLFNIPLTRLDISFITLCCHVISNFQLQIFFSSFIIIITVIVSTLIFLCKPGLDGCFPVTSRAHK